MTKSYRPQNCSSARLSHCCSPPFCLHPTFCGSLRAFTSARSQHHILLLSGSPDGSRMRCCHAMRVGVLATPDSSPKSKIPENLPLLPTHCLCVQSQQRGCGDIATFLSHQVGFVRLSGALGSVHMYLATPNPQVTGPAQPQLGCSACTC